MHPMATEGAYLRLQHLIPPLEAHGTSLDAGELCLQLCVVMLQL